jgi:hypothetical protein
MNRSLTIMVRVVAEPVVVAPSAAGRGGAASGAGVGEAVRPHAVAKIIAADARRFMVF